MSAELRRRRGSVRLTFPAEPMAVRAALDRLLGALPPGLLDADTRGSAEIVIAEVLNNIVEHAYAGAGGQIDVTLLPLADGLHCSVTDRGRPLADGDLPGAGLPGILVQNGPGLAEPLRPELRPLPTDLRESDLPPPLQPGRDQRDPASGPAIPVAVRPEDLPEGGFGWFLIRLLSRDIRYLRIGPANRLTFRLPVQGFGRIG